MLRLKTLSGKYQKRLIRPLYAQTQATPYAATLDDTTLTGPNAATGRTTFRNADGSFYIPASGDTSPTQTRTAAASTLRNSVIPGVVMVRTLADKVAVHSGFNHATTVEQPFGLLANFVGGDFDDIGDENQVGVWRGPDAVFELLAPSFDDTGLAAAYAASSTGAPVKLYAGASGRLTIGANLSGGAALGAAVVVAHLIERVSSSRIVIDLKI